MFHVYILQNPAGRFYIGHTADIEARLGSNNSEGATEGKYARKNGPWALVYRETWPSRGEAVLREREIKAWKSAVRIRELISLVGGPWQSPAKRD
jgi:putative endonuclease